MFNFQNLSDVEFEYLCKDVMSRKLEIDLHRFAVGRDGGIDITDDASSRRIVIQVKHYRNNNKTNLMSALKSEVQKVKTIEPQDYYIFCSSNLTPDNIKTIYEMFTPYMKSADHVVSLSDISDFLDEETNIDIVRKHFKLWIESTNVIREIYSQDISIDCNSLVKGIEEHKNLYVQTDAYQVAVSILNDGSALMLLGNPGVGKTFTSEMIVLNYLAQGYSLRYTTDITDIKTLKRSLSNCKESKEIVLLDDCFGQAYFHLKDTQCRELLSLIRYVNSNSNKKLIFNSRVSIYQEAVRRNADLEQCFENDTCKMHMISLDNVSLIDKAKILYNHLFFRNVPNTYIDDILRNNHYLEIVNHKNYNPRIIDYVTRKSKYENVNGSEYYSLIISYLNNPDSVWREEYEDRLEESDRILVNTLYSLTNTVVDELLLQMCYENRIVNESSIDTSIDHYRGALNRLQKSLVKIVDYNGRRCVAVANPSVNVFLRGYLATASSEIKRILKSAKAIVQYERLLDRKDFITMLRNKFIDCSVLDMVFKDDSQRDGYIAFYCAKFGVLQNVYREYVHRFMLHPRHIEIYGFDKHYDVTDIFDLFFDDVFYSFYSLKLIITDLRTLKEIMDQLDLKTCVNLVCLIDSLFDYDDDVYYDFICLVCDTLQSLIQNEYQCVEAFDYGIDVSEIINRNTVRREDCCALDEKKAIDEIECIVRQETYAQIEDALFCLPSSIRDNVDIDIQINVLYTQDFINGYYEYLDDRADEFRESTMLECNVENATSEIDRLFNHFSHGE